MGFWPSVYFLGLYQEPAGPRNTLGSKLRAKKPYQDEIYILSHVLLVLLIIYTNILKKLLNDRFEVKI
jgi:hypothetical protein